MSVSEHPYRSVPAFAGICPASRGSDFGFPAAGALFAETRRVIERTSFNKVFIIGFLLVSIAELVATVSVFLTVGFCCFTNPRLIRGRISRGHRLRVERTARMAAAYPHQVSPTNRRHRKTMSAPSTSSISVALTRGSRSTRSVRPQGHRQFGHIKEQWMGCTGS